MKVKLMYLMVFAALIISSISMGAVGIVGWDRANHTITRWDAYGHVLWQSTAVGHDAYQMEMGPDGYLYLGMWVDDRAAKIDPVTGARITELALQQTAVGDRWWDIIFGNDIDGDGIADLWAAAGYSPSAPPAGQGLILAYGSASGYAGSSEQAWFIPEVTRRTVALDFGPDVTGDGIADLWVLDGDGNDSGNNMRILDGATGAQVTSWSLASLRAPKDVVVKDDRVYVTSSAAHDIYSYALDGTDETREFTGPDSPEWYVRQIQPGPCRTWYTANRFSGNWPSGIGGITMFDTDWTNPGEFYSLSGSDFTGIVVFPAGAFGPVPVDGEKVPVETAAAGWINPEPNDVSGVISCDVYLTDHYPDYGTVSPDPNTCYAEDPNFLNYATKVIDNQAVDSLTLPALVYGKTYYWRVDTRDSSSPESGTAIGKVWRFVADNSAPQVNAGQTVHTWLTDGTVDVTMAPAITDDGRPDPPAAYTVLWEEVVEDPNVVINSPAAETTTVTITKTGAFELKLTADDSELIGSDTVIINVYTDACAAAKAQPGYIKDEGDLDNDCDVDLADFGIMAADWLNSTALTAPLP